MNKKAKQDVIKIDQVEVVRKNELAEFRKDIPAVTCQINIVVDSPESETKADAIVKKAKLMIKDADARRLKITRPLDLSKKETLSLFKDMTQPLRDVINVLSGKIIGHHQEQDRIAAEAECERLAELAELEAKQVAEQARVDALKTPKAKAKAQAKVDEIDDHRSELEQITWVPDVGSATVAKVWKCRIMNPKEVKREYCVPSAGLLQAAVRAGARNLNGCEVYQEGSVRSR